MIVERKTRPAFAVLLGSLCLVIGFFVGRVTATFTVVSRAATQGATPAPVTKGGTASASVASGDRSESVLPTETTPASSPLLQAPPPFALQRLAGSGQQATPRVRLESGLYQFAIRHAASGHFSVWLLDNTGEKVELLVNTSEPFDGSKAVRVPMAAEYLFDVSAEGPWEISFASPPLADHQTSFTAPGQAATPAFQLEPGLRVFRLSHAGSGHFSAWLLDSAGEKVELLANTSGSPFGGSKAVQVRGGWYVLDVSADRSWTITVE
jgi:hypothetical protein